MKNTVTLVIATLFSLSVIGQTEKVKGSLTTIDTADLTILNIYPDSFPNVSVVFKAETRRGEPVWNLTKDKMTVKENAQLCEVISIEQISKNKAINLGIVIDHSGSMKYDVDKVNNNIPINNAKSAVKNFVSTFDSKKDYISIVGFSQSVDEILRLTQNTSEINYLVDAMQASGSTALYDAMLTSIEEIKSATGVNILVVLTDGCDNCSKSKWQEVVEKANIENIPIYIISLGNVSSDTLSIIAKSTKGTYYYTKSSQSLNTVYAEISKQVQAFYNLVYKSPNFAMADSSRQIELSFDIAGIYLADGLGSKYPREFAEFLAKKEKERQYFLYGGIALAVLLSSGTLLFYYQRRRRSNHSPVIKKLFPNPSEGIINLDYESGKGQLQIMNLNGQVAKTFDVNGSEVQFDLSDLQDGNYMAVIQAEGKPSNAVNFIIKR